MKLNRNAMAIVGALCLAGCSNGSTSATQATPTAVASAAGSSCVVPDVNDADVKTIEAGSGPVIVHPTYGETLRTPKAQFANLPGYPFAAHYVDIDPGDDKPLYMHYIDEGPRNGQVVLMVHGNPAWSYLVRDHVKPLTAAGYRVLALDLIGFGKSDKPSDRKQQTFANQTKWVNQFMTSLELCEVNFFGQDWGASIGMRVAMDQPDRFRSAVFSNASLSDGTIPEDPTFAQWRDQISQQIPKFSMILDMATVAKMTPEEKAGWDAPWPSNEYTAGPRQLPAEVPFAPEDPEIKINQETLAKWSASDIPVLTLFSDPVPPETPRPTKLPAGEAPIGEVQQKFIAAAKGAVGQPHRNLDQTNAAHFISEDAPELVSKYLIEFFGSVR
jgi:haloalkane dehalogenase